MKFDKFNIFFICTLVTVTLGILCFIAGTYYERACVQSDYSACSYPSEVYMICDVSSIDWCDEYAAISIELPSDRMYTITQSYDTDIPDEFSEVVIKADDLDDVSTYSIVGIR